MLIESIQTNVDSNTIVSLLNEGADVNRKDNKGYTALTYAYEARRNDIVETLIHARAEVNVRNRKGEYLLTNSIKKQDERLINLLLTAGANVNLIEKSDFTNLTLAIVSKQRNVVKALIDHGADIHAPNKNGVTPLMLAVDRDLIITITLINSGANINEQNENGTTLLMRAAGISTHRGPESLIGLFSLPFKLIDWSIAKLSGTRDLIPVADVLKVIDYLINAGAEIDAKDKNGQTALMYASKYGTKERIAQLIKQRGFLLNVKYGAEINAIDNIGYTALMHSIKQDNFETFTYLLQLGADYSIHSQDGENALNLAKRLDRENYIKALIENGARY